MVYTQIIQCFEGWSSRSSYCDHRVKGSVVKHPSTESESSDVTISLPDPPLDRIPYDNLPWEIWIIYSVIILGLYYILGLSQLTAADELS